MVNKGIKILKVQPKSIDSTISEFIDEIKSGGEFQDFITYIDDKQNKIEDFIKPSTTEKEDEYKLIVLRKWNSYTPVLPQHDNYSNKGGGYFLKVATKGIVIDPGYNFVENFLNAGFKLDDIDYVFISHAHNDHSVELESLFSLLYKRNKSIEDSNKIKKIKLYMNLGTFKKFSAYFDLSKPDDKYYIDDIVILNKHQDIKIENNIEVFTTVAKHHEQITSNYSLGFIFKITLPDSTVKVIKFTCDTGWEEEIEKSNKELSQEFDIDKIDILVAHIGSIKAYELKYDATKKLSDNKECIYPNHLGLIGTVAMINYYNPELVLISEFGEEMDAIRHKLSKTLSYYMKRPVFATDLNFQVNLLNLSIRSNFDNKFYESSKIETLYKESQLYYINMETLNPTDKNEIQNLLGSRIKVY